MLDEVSLPILVFVITLFTALVILFSLLVSIIFPKYRIWPPPKGNSWQFWFTWVFYIVSILGSIALGWLDWDSNIFAHWIRFPVGGLLIFGGLTFANWGIRTLGWHRTSGLKGSFVSDGPYQYSRNPQYVGDSLAMLGYAIFCNSTLVLIVNLIGIISFLLTPFAEEPWLRDRFGQEYMDYKEEIPRFFSFKKLFTTKC